MDMSTVRDLINAVLAIDPSAPAVEEKGRWRSFADLARRRDSLDSLLNELDLGDDSRIAVFLENRFEPLACLLAVTSTDRCLVTINPTYPTATLSADIAALRPPVVVAEPHQWERPGLFEAVEAIGAAGIVLTGDDDEPARFVSGLDRVREESLRETQPGVAIEMLTSGTTGKPKRIPLTRRAFQQGFESALAYEKGRDEDLGPRLRPGVAILHGPLSHIGGLWGAINTIAAGRAICLLERFTVQDWADAVVRHRPKVSGAPPAALRMILEAQVPKESLSSLSALISGTAPVDPALVQAFLDTYGLPILTAYGATEFAGGVAGWNMPDFRAHYHRKIGSVGRLQRGVEGRIVNPDTDEILPPQSEGVLELRSKQLSDPVNWLRTTDRALMDEEGFLWIRGRADNAIIRGGFKVHPDDVVKAIEAHPSVREAAVVGIPDQRLGEVPAAAIILRAGAQRPLAKDLSLFLRDRLLPYQVPVLYRFVDDMPRTASLKPQLTALKELLSTPEAV
jgi:acyl-coenzyme A synthetase/AMP-(fatty) acid ligase